MRSNLVILTLVFAMFAVGSVQAQDKKSDDVAITGEIIDLKCFTSGMMGGRGPEHEECAIACMQGGLPVGIIDDKGNVYTVVPAKGMKSANEALVKYAAKRVTLKGKVIEKGGVRLIHYASLEPAK
jgi:hypothetical protein